MTPKYEIELWSRSGVLLADLSTLVKGFSYSMTRNDAEQLSFTMNLNAYEALAASVGTHPLAMLGPYQTDIKLKRNGTYLFGTHVGYVTTELDDLNEIIEVRAFGYINLLIDRYVTKSYANVDGVDIAWDLISETQSQENGNMGITLGPDQATSPLRERNYQRQSVKEAVLGLAILDNSFDVKINENRQFNTYTTIGGDKTASLQFIYPGNITKVSVPRDALPLVSKIYGVGSGFGNAALLSMQRDETSELNYGVHEKVSLFNSDQTMLELDDDTRAELDLSKEILEIPKMSINSDAFDLNLHSVGDRVTVRVEQHPFLSTVDGTYRIEKIEVDVDENDAENIQLHFDNYGLA